MKIVLAVSLLVAGCLATGNIPGSGGYGNSGVGQFSESELAMAVEFTDSISNENNFAQIRVDNLKQEEKILLDKLNDIILNTIPVFFDTQKTQDDRLDNIKYKIKRALSTLGPLETQLDGEKTMAELIDSQVTEFWSRFDSFIDEFNRKQNSSLQGIEAFLYEAKDKLHATLLDNKISAEDQVNELAKNALATVDFINIRRCFTTVVHVEVDEQTAEGEEDAVFNPSDLFDGNIPTAFCALQGFHSNLNLGQSQSYGPYGGYPDRHHNVALAVDCKPAADYVKVKVFDESRGETNRITGAYVLVKTCTFAPQAIAHY